MVKQTLNFFEPLAFGVSIEEKNLKKCRHQKRPQQNLQLGLSFLLLPIQRSFGVEDTLVFQIPAQKVFWVDLWGPNTSSLSVFGSPGSFRGFGRFVISCGQWALIH